MIKLTQSEKEEVIGIIPADKILSAYNDEQEYIGYKGYKLFSVYIFNCWLKSQDEFTKKMVNIPKNIDKERKRKRLMFFNFFYESNSFLYRNYFDDELNFSHYELFKFSSYKQFERRCIYHLQDSTGFILVCPSLNLVVQTHYDEIDFVYMKDKKTIQIVEEQAKNCGLYLLDDPTR